MKKKLCSVSFVLLLTSLGLPAHADTVTLAWDWDGDPTGVVWKLYVRTEGNAYDYSKPAAEQAYDVNPGTMLNYTIDLVGEQGTTVKLYMVLRASKNGVESGDSNEVEYDFFTYNPASANITGISTSGGVISQ